MISRFSKVFKGIEKSILVRLEKVFSRTDDSRIVWLQGIGWAVAGGSLAGGCLVFTKALITIFWLPGHPVSCSLLLDRLCVEVKERRN